MVRMPPTQSRQAGFMGEREGEQEFPSRAISRGATPSRFVKMLRVLIRESYWLQNWMWRRAGLGSNPAILDS